MPCSHHDGGQQPNIINLSQLEYSKSKCPIEEDICRLFQEISGVEKDISDAVARVKDLLSRHLRLKTEINRTHSLIMRDLPVEVLSRIFYACFSNGAPNYRRKNELKDLDVSLKMARVCRTWRQIAWSTPELWTVVAISRRFPSRVISRSSALSLCWTCDQYDMIREWVNRSGILPLNVSIYETMGEHNDIDVQRACSCWERTLKVLGESSYRWKDVSMNMSRQSYEAIASSVELKPPSRSLTLSNDCGVQSRTHRCGDALQLWKEPGFGPQRVITDAAVRFGHFNIGWQHVSHVDVKGWSVVDCLDLLKIAPRLVSCAFADVGGHTHGLDEPVICHESLQELSLYCITSPAAFFDNVAFPSLSSLAYPGEYDEVARLVTLSVVAHMFTSEHMVIILSTVPSLTHLKVYCPRNSVTRGLTRSAIAFLLDHLASTATTSTMEVESGRGSDSLFLPRLEALELLGSWEFDFFWSSAANIFGSPSEVGAEGRRPLRRLGLESWTPDPVEGLSDETVARFLSLKEAGINIDYILQPYSDATLPVTWEYTN